MRSILFFLDVRSKQRDLLRLHQKSTAPVGTLFLANCLFKSCYFYIA